MHDSVMGWMGIQTASLDLASLDVLEVGAMDVNGSVRPLFVRAKSYVGVDHEEGPGVDLVENAEALSFDDETVDLVVSTEMLEHCERPWRAVAEMWRMLHPGGTLLLTCRGFNERGAFPFHNPPDNYRYSSQALAAICIDAGFAHVAVVADPQVPGWFVTATKPDPTLDSEQGTATKGRRSTSPRTAPRRAAPSPNARAKSPSTRSGASARKATGPQ